MRLRFSLLSTMAPGLKIHRSFSPSAGPLGVTISRGERTTPAWACSASLVEPSRHVPAHARPAMVVRSASHLATGIPARPSPFHPVRLLSDPPPDYKTPT